MSVSVPLAVGVPAYRLPRQVIANEVAVIQALGVEIRCGVTVGSGVSFDSLRRDHAAVIIAVGAKSSRGLSLPGERGLQGIARLLHRPDGPFGLSPWAAASLELFHAHHGGGGRLGPEHELRAPPDGVARDARFQLTGDSCAAPSSGSSSSSPASTAPG